MRLRDFGLVLGFVAMCLFLFALTLAIIAAMVRGAMALAPKDEPHSTWPESAEFSQLMTGQERFSEHATNVDGLIVIVDHETGVQYLADGDGMTALLDVDGTPMRVKEAA